MQYITRPVSEGVFEPVSEGVLETFSVSLETDIKLFFFQDLKCKNIIWIYL